MPPTGDESEQTTVFHVDNSSSLSVREVEFYNEGSICFKANIRFIPSFTLNTLISSLQFTHDFSKSGRKAVYFGTHPYIYNGGKHEACSLISKNSYISELFIFICNAFPHLMLNSCLINYYPDSRSSIPFHADDELCIDPDSYIVTLSLGASRTLAFKLMEKRYSDEICHEIELSHGEILLFSRMSQNYFVHGISQSSCVATMSESMPFASRVSATFRKILP